MKLKPAPLEIPADDPFRNDVLGRKPLVESLSALVAGVTPPFVLCIDGPWGTGKTTFLQLWKEYLKGGEIQTLYFNAWTTDFTPDPLVAFVSEITELINASNGESDSERRIKRLRQIGSRIAKRAIPVVAKVASAGLIDADELTEDAVSSLAADLAGDAIQAYEKEKKLIEQFRTVLEELIKKLPAQEKEPRLLVLVDELDRCRPSYALELLERIKHVFNVPNVVFALALDKRQLRASVEAVYGSRVDSEDYLRRFIDLEVALPLPSKHEVFTDYLFGQFEFNEVFAKRDHYAFQYDVQNLKSTFNALARIFQISLRTREQCFARLRVAMLSTPDNHHIYPEMLILLIVLRAAARQTYERFISGDASVTDVLECLRSQSAGAKFVESDEGAYLEAFLIAAKKSRSGEVVIPELSEHQSIADSESQPQDPVGKRKKERAQIIITLLQGMGPRWQWPNLQYLVSKVELGKSQD